MPPKIPIPRGWNRRAKSAILHILALSHYTFTAMVRREAVRRELAFFMCWYNGHRPHGPLGVRTPDEVYGGLAPACERP